MKPSSLIAYCSEAMLLAIRHTLLRSQPPLLGGIAINDKCNLSCIQCSVSNRGLPDMTMDEIRTGLKTLRDMGIPTLFIEGGEPFMWRDGPLGLEDVVIKAKQTGFRTVIVYTNGTFPLSSSADTLFVSLDGLQDTNDRLRGRSFDAAVGSIINSSHRKILINYTISAQNEGDIEEFCDFIPTLRHIKGVFFYFYTPCDGTQGLHLDLADRRRIIQRILALKERGYPILNSKAGLRVVYKNTWNRPTDLCCIYANNTLYQCCRAIGNEEACRSCGYLGYAELQCLARLKPSAICAAIRST
ncbi:MAG: radical SAM protein [Planctomycetota bacterium]